MRNLSLHKHTREYKVSYHECVISHEGCINSKKSGGDSRSSLPWEPPLPSPPFLPLSPPPAQAVAPPVGPPFIAAITSGTAAVTRWKCCARALQCNTARTRNTKQSEGMCVCVFTLICPMLCLIVAQAACTSWYDQLLKDIIQRGLELFFCL